MISPMDGYRSGSRTPASMSFEQGFPSAPTRSPLLTPNSDDMSFGRRPKSPLTKRVDHVFYETNTRMNHNPWSTPPEFLKVFSDAYVPMNGTLEWECVLFGNPRPRITWYFNDKKMNHSDVEVINHCDTVKLVIKKVKGHHYGHYNIICENEVGQANASAHLRHPGHQ